MDGSKGTLQTSGQWWEDRLADEYRDYRWHQLMEPMCEKMEKWRRGELAFAEMDKSLETCCQRAYEVRSVLTQRNDRLVLLIQLLDREWFDAWVEQHVSER